MKRFLFTILVLQLYTLISYSQTGWVWQNPTPQGNTILKMKIFDNGAGLFFNKDHILRTTNGGGTWIYHYTGFPANNSSVSIVDDNLFYMLTDSTILIRSTDKGITWKYVSNVQDIKWSQITFISPQTGFAVKSKYNNYYITELMRTGDGGKNWTLSASYDSISIYSVYAPNMQTVYACGSKYNSSGSQRKTKFFKSTDSGNTWDTIANNIYFGSAKLHFFDEHTGYMYGTRVYKTTNGGNNWTVFNGLTTISHMQFFDAQTALALSGSRFYKTTNGGSNWQYTNIYHNNAQYTAADMHFADLNTGYITAGMGEILKTTNAGINWLKLAGENVLQPHQNEYLWDICFADKYTGFAAGDQGKLLRTTDGGNKWEKLQLFPGLNFEAIASAGPQTFYVSEWNNGKVLKTTNAGNSWDTTYANSYGITELEFINESTGFGVCKYNNFIKTTNGGVNWLVTQPFGSQNWALDFIDENTGFAGGSRIYKTTDGGLSWDTISFGNMLYYYAESIKFINNTTGFLAGSGVILKTENGGLNWSRVFSMPSGYFMDMQFVNAQTGYTITTNDVYKTTNSGINWEKLPHCVHLSGFQAMSFADSANGWIAGYYGTIIRTSNGDESVYQQPPFEQIPTEFYLYQNYPNPFNPITTIRFGLPKDSQVSIKIYDILGRLVKLLVNESRNAGSYSLSFDGSQFASGVYFYTIETPDFVQSKKMVLLK